jgi:hypothetical protein
MAFRTWRAVLVNACLTSASLVGGCSEPDSSPVARDAAVDDEADEPASQGSPKPKKPDASTEPDLTDGDDEDAVESPRDAGSSLRPSADAASSVSPSVPDDGPAVGGFDYAMQDVKLSKDLVIPEGKTVRVGPAVTFTAALGIKVQVLGTLIVEGTEQTPSSFLGADKPRSWHGIVVEKGGKLQLSHAKIGGAAYGIWAKPGSDFSVDYTEIGTSFKAAIIESDGSFTHTRFAATTPDSISLASEVSVDDPNGTLTIMDASPSISNSSFDGSSGYTDMVRIGGKSSPTFDHVYLHSAHCGFHTFGGTNTSARITNAIFENLAYGIMAYTTKPIVEDSVFRKNTNDVGMCSGATEANAPALRNNHYADGSPLLDPSCFLIGTTDASPASTANTSAGPSGL